MLSRASSTLRSARALRSAATRRMCTAVAEAEAEALPYAKTAFSFSDPHAQKIYAGFAVTYLFALKWQAGDRTLAEQLKELAPPPAAPAAAEEPAAASAVVAAVASAPPGSSPADWKVADVQAWLAEVELPMHAPAFKTHAVDGKLLLTLSEQDMYSTLGVTSPLHRKKLMMAIGDLRKAYLAA